MTKRKRIRWTGHIAQMGRKGMHIRFWWGRQNERETTKPRRRWDDNIEMDLREIGWTGMD
jgi:hypothetical protein